MAVCSPPYTMHNPNTVSSLPIDLMHSWSQWRPSAAHDHSQLPHKPHLVQQPPQTQQPALPPIAHLDRHLSRLSPLTPPQAEHPSQWRPYAHPELKLPPIVPQPSSRSYSPIDVEDYDDERQRLPSPHPEAFDWFTSSHRPSNFIAEKMCEMVCYLWFSSLSPHSPATDSPSSAKRSRKTQDSPTFFPKPNASTARLQFAVSPAFVRFMQKLLETTQVSQSVIVLSLRYIYRLKERNRYTHGSAGSEYRVAVAALMLANKFVDDNTYTNKTWSEVSGIALDELNKMEREFLMGIDFSLYVDEATYDSWLNLLQGLILAKEKYSRQWNSSRSRTRVPRPRLAHLSQIPARYRSGSQRARSISPSRPTSSYPYSAPPLHRAPVPQLQPEEPSAARSGAKRTASDAFSPTSVSFPPIKRPTGLSLDIPELTYTGPSTANSVSPSEPLQGFSNLSLGASPVGVRQPSQHDCSPVRPTNASYSVVGQDQVPQTLVRAYHVDDKNQFAAPRQLYFYSLAGSPLDAEEESRFRKARLRYHQAPFPAPVTYVQYPPRPSVPMVVQSATASPHDLHANLSQSSVLPNFAEGFWHRAGAPVASTEPYQYHYTQPAGKGSVPAATFANAGPPGYHFYPNTAARPHSPSHQTHWPRGRQA
ncbi:hypothetical protein K474DRAFT_1660340 [Panus rudis PR-1116 ss-1]|nr:hypothetical protein K474DRAFT_1660340 [Panus rudis PR-1116 ss-1]